MSFSNARAVFSLRASGTPTSQGTTGTVEIGPGSTTIRFPDGSIPYAFRAIYAGSGDDLELNLGAGSTAGSTAWVAGAAQVDTATAAGTITTAGEARLTVTSAGMTGSPLVIPFEVALNDTAAQWAAKGRAALLANETISARFEVIGSGTAIGLQRKPTKTYTVPGGTLPIYAANDASLNIATSNNTSAGLTPAATSANTTAGVISDGVKIYDGDGKDFEGTALVVGSVLGLLIQSEGGVFTVEGNNTDSFTLADGEAYLRASVNSLQIDAAMSILAAGPGALSVTLIYAKP